MSPALIIVAITVLIALAYMIHRARSLASGQAGCNGNCSGCHGSCAGDAGWDRILHPRGREVHKK